MISSKDWSAFCYHVLAILSNVSDKMFFPTKDILLV